MKSKNPCLLISILVILLAVTGILSAQTSRIPADLNNWLSSASTVGAGDRDQINVVFFEIPDTVSSTLYFAINHPGITGVSPDQNTAAAGQDTVFTLIGGAGALSHQESRQIEYSTGSPYQGTQLGQMSYIDTTTGWVYFPGVSPSQGEHIGNKYYFKVVVEILGGGYKNSYQMDISLINSGNPTQISDANSFCYAWNIALMNGGADWDIFPFVPTGTVNDYVVVSLYDYDQIDAGDITGTVYNKTDQVTPLPPLADISDSGEVANTSYQVAAGEDTGTWKVVSNEGNLIVYINTSEFYVWLRPIASGPVNDRVTYPTTEEILRSYSANVTVGTADHIALAVEDGIAIDDGADIETITMQVVDLSGTPQPYKMKVWVDISGSGEVIEVNDIVVAAFSAGYVDMDTHGLATIGIRDAATETVDVTIITNGNTAPGLDAAEWDTSATHDTVQVDFQANPLPTMSSAQNTSFTEGNVAAVVLPDITITEVGPTSITTGQDILIRIPAVSAVNVDFSATIPTFAGDIGSSATSFDDTDHLRITPAANFNAGNTMIIQGLELAIGAVETSFYLEMSFDGGTTYNVIDDKIIIIQDNNTTYTWTGATNANWNLAANWDPATVPNGAGDNAIIPDVTNQPVLDVIVTLNNLSISNSATMDLSGFNLTVGGTFDNDGTLLLQGTEVTVTLTMDTDSGLVLYYGNAGSVGLAAG
ncbi:MAG: hypothetical protein KAU17_08720, partial [Spirochaetales bacterium]|nr:hypothetical protein [Spirochaetales bacterium]